MLAIFWNTDSRTTDSCHGRSFISVAKHQPHTHQLNRQAEMSYLTLDPRSRYTCYTP